MSSIAAGPPMLERLRALPGRSQTADRLVAALRSEEFVLYAQHIAPAAEDGNEPPCQEILIRFLEEEEKLLPPGSFFPILEAYGLMAYLDRWVVNRTIRWLRRQPLDASPSRSAINLSNDTLLDDSFAAFVEKQIRTGEIAGANLLFEVAWSTALAYQEPVRALAAAVRPLGCGLSISSYDGAAASLAVLESFAPDIVKISGDLIGRMDRDPMDISVVEGISRNCQDMGIRTVAEHVERPVTLAIAREIGIDYVQGFLVACPAPLA